LLADVIGWDYVELHASHFVAEGLAAVQKTADRIFKQLLELDHAVILFDEIDELVREREMEEDAFGRFLTTSMLPKLAELWKARKIVYFVATNHINYFDSAIIRSHRFDALILVGPPSFEAKLERIGELLPAKYKAVTFDSSVKERVRKEFDDLLNSAPKTGDGDDRDGAAKKQAYDGWLEQRVVEPKYFLAKFLLLRYDELDELAYHLEQRLKQETQTPKTISETTLREALGKVSDSQWRKNKSYADYDRDEQFERRDYQMLKTWEVVSESVKGRSPEVKAVGDRCWLTRRVDSIRDIQIDGCELEELAPASVRILAALEKSSK
jgi:hypothetical protein